MNSILLRRTLNALAAVVLLGASSANLSSQSPQALAAHRLFWNTTLSDFAMFSVSAETAAMAVVDSDHARAARVLAYGQKSLDRGTDALHRMPPDRRSINQNEHFSSPAPPRLLSATSPRRAANHTVTIADGATTPVEGTLLSASATADQPCDLIVFENGQSRLLQVTPSGTALNYFTA